MQGYPSDTSKTMFLPNGSCGGGQEWLIAVAQNECNTQLVLFAQELKVYGIKISLKYIKIRLINEKKYYKCTQIIIIIF